MDDDMAIMAKATGKLATSLVVWWAARTRKRLTLLSRFGLVAKASRKKKGATFSVAAGAGALSRSVFYTAFRR
jgi:hypothetical protein